MLFFLVFSLIPLAVSFLACPNGQRPKLDDNGKMMQCLPGSNSTASCGNDFSCYFSGVNFMCCPNNEPSSTNMPSCPETFRTVYGENRRPLKCSRMTRRCPEEIMQCMDVGIDFICCEPNPISKKKTKKTKVDECPKESVQVLNEDGEKAYCSDSNPCNEATRFCFGRTKICCEMVDNTPEVEETTKAPVTAMPASIYRKYFLSKMKKPSVWIGYRTA